MAWWQFDAPDGLKYPGLDLERSTLWRLGLLDETERGVLEREWRDEFDTAQKPGFVEYKHNEVVTGARARRLYYAWADIPHELVTRWTAELNDKKGPGRTGAKVTR